MKKRNEGFTLVEIMIVVAIIGLLALIAIPSLLQAREETHKKTVSNNLRLIDNAMDRVMLVSNYTSVASITKPMVDLLVDSLDISAMKWPKGSILITANGDKPILDPATTTPLADWNDFLTNDVVNGYLAVVLYNTTNTTNKALME